MINIFKNLKTATSFTSKDISVILEAIETGKFTNNDIVIHTGAKLASAEDKYSPTIFIDGVNKYNFMKLNKVMSWCPNGSFKDNHRKTGNLESLSGYVYFDIDSVDAEATRLRVSRLPFVYAAWKSLSGTGIGFLVKADWTVENFKSNYTCLSKFFSTLYGLELDKTSDFTRTNVFSYDPDIYINTQAESIKDFVLEPFKEDNSKTKTRNENVFYENDSNSKVIIAIRTALKSKGRFEPGNRHHFLTSFIGTAMTIGIPYDEVVEEFESYLIDQGDLDLFDIMYFDKMWEYFQTNYNY
jgi:VirE N-terminal domain